MVQRLFSPPFALENRLSQQSRRFGVLAIVSWLQARPGGTWQERWLSSGAETAADWRTLVDPSDGQAGPSATRPLGHLAPGLSVMICADVIRPGLPFLLASAGTRRNLALEMARTRDPEGFAALVRSVDDGDLGLQAGQQALTRIACILAAKGGLIADVTAGDCVELLELARQMRGEAEGRAGSPLFYQLLRDAAVLGDDAPATLRVFAGRGQPSCEQLIDRYDLACQPVRDVLVDYLAERQPSVDFSSLQRFAYLLGKLFWADLEAHHPGIDSLKIPREVAAAWKQRVMTRTKAGSATARLDGRSVLSTVRAFYLDLAEWAEEDPARWGPFAVRSPVSASDVSHKKDRLRRKSRMDHRTRERLPVLPTLVRFVEAERRRAAELLAVAEAAAEGELSTGRIWAEEPENRQRRDLTFEEHRAFWTWAMVEVLRHTGLRIEELSELSHHSLVQYRLPASGELVPLLQIAPSKDRSGTPPRRLTRAGRRARHDRRPGP